MLASKNLFALTQRHLTFKLASVSAYRTFGSAKKLPEATHQSSTPEEVHNSPGQDTVSDSFLNQSVSYEEFNKCMSTQYPRTCQVIPEISDETPAHTHSANTY
ncbi:hypothetical protein BB560_004652 [Smittium megazygosporum]|uniref:Uncharacterized protein n=1 Tax=Smittium megazygosporum TaxID=133381 RepID=A0A2T9Z8U5_9FUNG|nr:hypothetical protein BB560_006307 [Smittium megazygosporum]PVV00947.1 hypothetical protein BB560_004652 [Smittium megazygosporum]